METQENKIETKQAQPGEEYESPGQFKIKKKEEPTLVYSPFAELLKNRLTK